MTAASATAAATASAVLVGRRRGLDTLPLPLSWLLRRPRPAFNAVAAASAAAAAAATAATSVVIIIIVVMMSVTLITARRFCDADAPRSI